MRAVVDPNVLIAGLLAPHGAPANVLRAWRAGRFELVASSALLDELARALAYPKLRRRIPAEQAERFVAALTRQAVVAESAGAAPVRSRDPGDDYLIALAYSRKAVLVSGDRDLLELADRIPVFTPAEFLRWLDAHAGGGKAPSS